ncbi:hypothetical protein LXA43DRAFT_1101732 [Ganoderma leucocontextum]|nr:hypothetical protein LXA43DRAFT_1101732 [Ganoderma leucocontextum]
MPNASPFGTFNVPGNAPNTDADDSLFPLPTNPPPRALLPNGFIYPIRTNSITLPLLPSARAAHDRLQQIPASIASNFIFRDLDQEQAADALNLQGWKATPMLW